MQDSIMKLFIFVKDFLYAVVMKPFIYMSLNKLFLHK
jgi:hypothetical protein